MDMGAFFENVRGETIYIALLNEGTDVWRPARALRVGPHTSVVVLAPDYSPEDEEWQFPPGSIVRCEERIMEGTPRKVAVARDSGMLSD